ncbi:MAG: MBL fold metallo-hydrolase [Deltaproteobacteria bacterium]|jgi:glyoxylase-like metal-dependent hydrolase (beta-lactamase superfamily II)|nr:MBL fold metallo-hydrolase [Deltaproteobacteria bacterium]
MQLGNTGIYIFYAPPTGDICCNTVVIGGQEKIIIDPGLSHLWPYLERTIHEETGISGSDFSLVIHTHSHPDHMAAGSQLENKHGVPQAMTQEEKTYLEGPGQSVYNMFGLDLPTISVSRILTEGPLELGDKVLEIYLTPGHTPGSVCIYDPKNKILVTGDLVFSRSFGRVDLQGGDAKELCESVLRMAELDVQALLPGHGPSVVGREQVKGNFKYIIELMKECGYM